MIGSLFATTQKTEKLTRQPSFDKYTTTTYEAIRKVDKMKSYLKHLFNSEIYSEFYSSLTNKETTAIVKYQSTSPSIFYAANKTESVEILNQIFVKVPELPNTIYVYRCYVSGVSITHLIGNPGFTYDDIPRFLSTTLSFEVAKQTCGFRKKDSGQGNCYRNNDKQDYLIICIIIPKGSKVLPFMDWKSYDPTYPEYEILLPSTGSIVKTESCHPVHNVPIFIYRDSTNVKEEDIINDTDKEDLIRNVFQIGGRYKFGTNRAISSYEKRKRRRSIKRRYRRGTRRYSRCRTMRL